VKHHVIMGSFSPPGAQIFQGLGRLEAKTMAVRMAIPDAQAAGGGHGQHPASKIKKLA
jgi:hypothetical protein